MLIIGDLNNTTGGRKCFSMVQVAYGDAQYLLNLFLNYIILTQKKKKES